MRKLSLTRGKVALVDDADYSDLVKHKWCAYPHRRTWYAMRMEGSTKVLLHRTRWAASIRDGSRTASGRAKARHLGLFDTQVEAAMAYDQAALESFGEFAALNFPRAKDA